MSFLKDWGATKWTANGPNFARPALVRDLGRKLRQLHLQMEGLDRPKVGEWRDTKGFYGASIPLAWAQDGRRQGLKIETQRTCAANVCLPQHMAPQYGFQDFQRSLPCN